MGFKNDDSCLMKAAPDEPIFVLRAKDRLAPALVRMWAHLAALHGCPEPKVREAFICATAMEEWGKNVGTKWPD